MKFKELIDELEEIIEDSSKIPFSNKCMIDKEEVFNVIQQVRLAYPEDIKQAEFVNKERERLIQEAEEEARIIKEEAKNKVAKLVNDSEIVRLAKEKAAEILNDAKNQAKGIVADGEAECAAMAEEREKQLRAYEDEVRGYIANVLQRAESASENAVSTISKTMAELNSQYDALRNVSESLSKNRVAILQK